MTQPVSSSPPFRSAALACLLGAALLADGAGAVCTHLDTPGPAKSPAFPVPECVNGTTGAIATCGTGSVRLWPDGFRPGMPGQQLPGLRDSTNLRGGTLPAGMKWGEHYYSIDVTSQYVYAAYNVGFSIWQHTVTPEEPLKVAQVDGWDNKCNNSPNNCFQAFPGISEQLNFVFDVDVIETASKDIIFLAGKPPVGPSVWTYDGVTLKQLYQDGDNFATAPSEGSGAVDVDTFTHNGVHYGLASGNDGIFIYNLTAAAARTTQCLDDRGANCPGVYVGKLPNISTKTTGASPHVVGNKLFVVHSTSGVGNPTMVEIALPPSASAGTIATTTRWNGSDVGNDVDQPLFFQWGGTTFVAFVKSTQARIYNVGHCLDADGCADLGTAEWTRNLPNTSPVGQYFLTFSMSGNTPYLYLGVDGSSAFQTGSDFDQLWDLTPLHGTGTSGPITEITDGGGQYTDPCNGTQVDYWGRYLIGNSYGFNEFHPRIGQFVGNYFYRAGKSIFDVHVRGAGGGGIPVITTNVTSPSPHWFNVPVSFAATAQSCTGADSWEWFSDNTTATGLGTGPSTKSVTWNLCAAASCPDETAEVWALKDACADAANLQENRAHITLKDPRPRISSLDTDPSAPDDTFPVCTALRFDAGIDGRTPFQYQWSVRRAGALGGEDDVVSGVGSILDWDTSGVELEPPPLLTDGFESGDTSFWALSEGGAALTTAATKAYEPPAPADRSWFDALTKGLLPSQEFDVTLNASNAHGSDTETLRITLTGLGVLGFGAPAIGVTDLGGGSYRFTANSQNATEWRWELEDPGNGTSVGCQFFATCVVLASAGGNQEVEHAWTPPNVPGTYGVRVTAANCESPVGITASTSVSPMDIEAPEPPTVSSLSVNMAASPGCSQGGGFIDCPVNQAITFSVAFANATSLEFDWNGDGTWDQTVAATGSVTHTYAATQFVFQPVVRGKSGSGTSVPRAMMGYLTIE